MRIPKLKLKVNLEELFGTSGSFDDSLKQAVGQAIIDRITERTSERRIDKFGKVLKGYSKSYAASLTGQVAGKSQGEPANLLLTGDMLNSMTILETTAKTITIGFGDSEQNAKAFGHISGMEGHPTIKNGKVRDFFGLPKSEFQAIKREFMDQVESQEPPSRARRTFEERTRRFIEEIEDEIGES